MIEKNWIEKNWVVMRYESENAAPKFSGWYSSQEIAQYHAEASARNSPNIMYVVYEAKTVSRQPALPPITTVLT
jgi:hypothetical protein